MNDFFIEAPGSPEEERFIGEALDAFNLQQVPATISESPADFRFIAKTETGEKESEMHC